MDIKKQLVNLLFETIVKSADCKYYEDSLIISKSMLKLQISERDKLTIDEYLNLLIKELKQKATSSSVKDMIRYADKESSILLNDKTDMDQFAHLFTHIFSSFINHNIQDNDEKKHYNFINYIMMEIKEISEQLFTKITLLFRERKESEKFVSEYLYFYPALLLDLNNNTNIKIGEIQVKVKDSNQEIQDVFEPKVLKEIRDAGGKVITKEDIDKITQEINKKRN